MLAISCADSPSQCLSSINDFADLVSTIQSMRGINPLQARFYFVYWLVRGLAEVSHKDATRCSGLQVRSQRRSYDGRKRAVSDTITKGLGKT
jgi:hypothetical protein